MKKKKLITIYFDMDGTIANLYSVDNWLTKLRAFDSSPYEQAKPLINLSQLARYLNKLQRKGYKLGIVSWLSKESTPEYDAAVTESKLKWLRTHLKSVKWDEIVIVPYGIPKSTVVSGKGILFDDEERNRIEWGFFGFPNDKIFEILRLLS